MYPIRFKRRQYGFTLIEMMIVTMLSLVVVLAAGAIFRGVNSSFKLGSHKVVGGQGASQLSTVLSRRMRVASSFVIYNVGDRTVATDPGNGLALLDDVGNVTYRFEWDAINRTLADSTGARLTAMTLQSLQFRADSVSPRTVRYAYQTINDQIYLVDIESAVSLRN